MVAQDTTGRSRFGPGPSGKPYFLLNIILAGVILSIMGYSLLYSPDEEKYPVPCIHEKLTGEPCPSCGMSHAFSLIVRGRLAEAMEWNNHSLRLFLFFALQLLMRISLAVVAFRTTKNLRAITVTDAVVSSVMVLTAFWPLLGMTWQSLF
ncbi:MAG: DUF2752 domain-containing protein [Bacteroidales bacterium]|nr:DUF2752 domain-containing protein [Bacteroidales bacterium]